MSQSVKFITAVLFSLVPLTLAATGTDRSMSSLQPDHLPPDHQSSYTVNAYGAHVGELHNHLETQNTQISYTSEITVTGLASMFVGKKAAEFSILSIALDQHSKYPLQKSYRLNRGKSHKKNQNMTFTRDQQGNFEINGQYRKKTYSLKSQSPLWSRHVIPLLMSSDLLLKNDTTGGTFKITDKGNINDYNYTLKKTETIKFNEKSFPVLKFMIQKPGSSRMSYVWLSKAHYYLPLKIEQYKKGELTGSMQIKNISFTHRAPAND